MSERDIKNIFDFMNTEKENKKDDYVNDLKIKKSDQEIEDLNTEELIDLSNAIENVNDKFIEYVKGDNL